MKYRRWTNKEHDFVVKNYCLIGIKGCCEALNRSEGSIKGYLKWHREIPRPVHIWTEADYEIIRRYYPQQGRHQVARMLGVTFRACGAKAQKLGIKYRPVKENVRYCNCCKRYKQPFKGPLCPECKVTPLPQNYRGLSRKERRQIAREKRAL